jgi:hypothetical protein
MSDTDLESRIADAREEFLREAEAEFNSDECTAARREEFMQSQEVEDLWTDEEEKAWERQKAELEDEWGEKLARELVEGDEEAFLSEFNV